MNWSSELPTKPGDYAWKSEPEDGGYILYQVRMSSIPSRGLVVEADNDFPTVAEMKGYWCSLVPKVGLEILCQNWAEDHTHLQQLCREVGCTVEIINGNDHVLGIQELADLFRAQLVPKKWLEEAYKEGHSDGCSGISSAQWLGSMARRRMEGHV